MANATVTLKVSPNELQIIVEALRMLHHVGIYTSRAAADPLENHAINWDLMEGDPRRMGIAAERIRIDIGLD